MLPKAKVSPRVSSGNSSLDLSQELFMYSKRHINLHTLVTSSKQAAGRRQCHGPGVPKVPVEAGLREFGGCVQSESKTVPPKCCARNNSITQPMGNSKDVDLFSPITTNLSSLHLFPAGY